MTLGIGAGLIVCGVLNKRFLVWNNRLLHDLGDASYSTYLTHLFALGVLRVAWVKIYPAPVGWISAYVFMLLALIVCCAVGWMVYRILEVPLLARLRTTFAR